MRWSSRAAGETDAHILLLQNQGYLEGTGAGVASGQVPCTHHIPPHPKLKAQGLSRPPATPNHCKLLGGHPSAASLCASSITRTACVSSRAKLHLPQRRRHLEPSQAAASSTAAPRAQVITGYLMAALNLSAPGLSLLAQPQEEGFSSGRSRESFASPSHVAAGCSCPWLGPCAEPCGSWALFQGTHHPQAWARRRRGRSSSSLPSCQSTIDQSRRCCRDLAPGWNNKRTP